MIDIHAHILPGIDDGSESLRESLDMAELAGESGVHTIVATPHCNIRGCFENYYSPSWQEHFRELKAFLKGNGSEIRLLPGMEIYATDDTAKKIKDGRLISINDSRYYLIEFPFDGDPYWMGEILDSVLSIDKVPVIAHPERYYCVQDDPMILYEWMKQGCLSQLNKGSFFGRFGRHAGKSAEMLLRHNLVTCIASDAHSPYQRTTFMGDIRDYLVDIYGERAAERLLHRNPGRIISDEVISNEQLERPASSRWFHF